MNITNKIRRKRNTRRWRKNVYTRCNIIIFYVSSLFDYESAVAILLLVFRFLPSFYFNIALLVWMAVCVCTWVTWDSITLFMSFCLSIWSVVCVQLHRRKYFFYSSWRVINWTVNRIRKYRDFLFDIEDRNGSNEMKNVRIVCEECFFSEERLGWKMIGVFLGLSCRFYRFCAILHWKQGTTEL